MPTCISGWDPLDIQKPSYPVGVEPFGSDSSLKADYIVRLVTPTPPIPALLWNE